MELKVKVFRNLPYATLRNFMFLSKECMEVSSLLKPSVHAVSLYDEANEVKSFAAIVVYDTPDEAANVEESYTIGFSSVKGRSCIARRSKKGGQNVASGLEYPMESCSTVSMRVLFQITKNLKPGSVDLHLTNIADAKITLSKLPSTSLITCGALTVHAVDFSFLSMLMPHVSPGCILRFYVYDPSSFEDNVLNSGLFDFEVVKAAPFIDINVDCEINDEQFICLRASNLHLKAPRISEKGLNALILGISCSHLWKTPNCSILFTAVDEREAKSSQIRIAKTKTFNYDMIFENVDKTKVQSSSLELLQIPFFDKYVKIRPPHERLALVRNELGDRLLVNISLNYCEIVDPYSEYMSRNYR
ncbi:unnamed protein product [Cylicocyclus nassatus]|uniref:Uncharacterized protein n=1 Tax=Cylicocyclus nassatus TaxID=53992 RepID=A0AA36DUM0_CYLNA|nr:unnamed protein product [Cylicocyclus nassatus]